MKRRQQSLRKVVFSQSGYQPQLTLLRITAALNFVEHYYRALESHRATIATFYMEPTTSSDGKALPTIVYNGCIYADGHALQKAFLEVMPPSHFDVQSVDSHCLNPNYVPEGTQGGNPASEINMSVLVTVSGSVRLEANRSAPLQGFSESLILVPNIAATRRNTRGKPVKGYLVQSQTFRLVS